MCAFIRSQTWPNHSTPNGYNGRPGAVNSHRYFSISLTRAVMGTIRFLITLAVLYDQPPLLAKIEAAVTLSYAVQF